MIIHLCISAKKMTKIFTILVKSIILCYFCGNLFSQEVPIEFFEYKLHKFLFDHNINENWSRNSIFGPLRYQDINEYPNNVNKAVTDSLKTEITLGAFTKNDAVSIFSYGKILYLSNFYAFSYPRITNSKHKWPRFTGVSKKKSRFHFNSAETDISGLGYQNDWLILQFGRGRQSWGAGTDIFLALSDDSPAYDYGMIDLMLNSIRFRYFHGFLEHSNDFNRYLTGRGIEWNNKRNLLLSLSEIVIYSGYNRPIDIAYLNPISSHLEIESNNRQNNLGYSSGNGVWQLSGDFLINKNYRFSGNFLIDEFTIDKVQRDTSKAHGLAFSAKLMRKLNEINYPFNIYFSYIYIGTHTLRNANGYNNFVQRDFPLGWEFGSDGQASEFGINYMIGGNLIGDFSVGLRKVGENTIINNPYSPYENYKVGPFPSGIVHQTVYINKKIFWRWKKNIHFHCDVILEPTKNQDRKTGIDIGVDIYKKIR